jgi:hypothetical protein
LLEAADAGRTILYPGLAELLVKELAEDDLATLLPPAGRGHRLEQVMEIIAERDPRELLEDCFGKAGVRRLAIATCPKLMAELASPLEALLAHFGLIVPRAAGQLEGVADVRDRLRKLAGRITQAADRPSVTGAFLDGCTSVERIIRHSIWGWARLVFGTEHKDRLLALLTQNANPPGRQVDLDRLSFGHIASLFRALPDCIAGSSAAGLIERKIGRRHIYLPLDRKKRFSQRLDEFVRVRNKVEHDKDNYRGATPLAKLRLDLAGSLEEAEKLLHELTDERAIPRVAVPFLEIRDKWNRITYRLTLDDRTDIEARFSTRIELGRPYLYFGGNVNPRPVDPLILSAEELGDLQSAT